MANDYSATWSVIGTRDRPRFAINASLSRHQQFAALRRMQTPTVKGRVLRHLLSVASAPAGLAAVLPSAQLGQLWPLSTVDLAEWTAAVSPDGSAVGLIAMAWSQSRFRDRMYVFAVTGTDPTLRFYKLALNEDAVRPYRREAEIQDVRCGPARC